MAHRKPGAEKVAHCHLCNQSIYEGQSTWFKHIKGTDKWSPVHASCYQANKAKRSIFKLGKKY